MKIEIDYYAAFVRQRRGLVVLSALLVVYHWLHPTINRVGFANVYVDLQSDQEVLLVTALWVVWVYFLYRFHVYRAILADQYLNEAIDKWVLPRFHGRLS